jgi:hypothetical protein
MQAFPRRHSGSSGLGMIKDVHINNPTRPSNGLNSVMTDMLGPERIQGETSDTAKRSRSDVHQNAGRVHKSPRNFHHP